MRRLWRPVLDVLPLYDPGPPLESLAAELGISRIPVLGALFGYQNYQKNRQELMLLLTPRVITDLDQSNAVTREFKQKLDTLRRDLDIKAR